MLITVAYTLSIDAEASVGRLPLYIEYVDAKTLREYIGARGIVICHFSYQGFSIDYESPAQRTATELVMSGCSRTCTLIATEVE